MLALSFPAANLFPLAWIALVPLLSLIPARTATRAGLLGFATGTLASAGILYWIFPMIQFNTGSWLQALVCLAALSAYLGLYYGVWSFVLGLFSTGLSVLRYSFISAALWVSLEFLRSYFLTGFPWALLGFSQWEFIPIIQVSEYTGVYGVSFLIVLVNTVVARLVVTRRFLQLLPFAAAMAAVALCGRLLLERNYFSPPPYMHIALLQGNIDQYKKWDDAYGQEIIDVYTDLARKASAAKPELIIWPETAVPGFLPADPRLFSWVSGVARQTGAYQMAGAPYNNGGRDSYNASFLFGPEGEFIAAHRKTHLVPFGEYVPMRKALEPFFGVLNQLGDFSRGSDNTVLPVKSIFWGPTICSENFFGDVVRKFVRNGADVLVNQTNDAWFFRTAAAEQHFIMNVFRAVENRRTVVVCGNTGISGIVEPSGRISRRLEPFKRGYLLARVAPAKGLTFYSRWGDFFAALCIAAVFFALFRYRFLIRGG